MTFDFHLHALVKAAASVFVCMSQRLTADGVISDGL